MQIVCARVSARVCDLVEYYDVGTRDEVNFSIRQNCFHLKIFPWVIINYTVHYTRIAAIIVIYTAIGTIY